jgi:hypothetical protein
MVIDSGLLSSCAGPSERAAVLKEHHCQQQQRGLGFVVCGEVPVGGVPGTNGLYFPLLVPVREYRTGSDNTGRGGEEEGVVVECRRVVVQRIIIE